jgi:hypothetical protein
MGKHLTPDSMEKLDYTLEELFELLEEVLGRKLAYQPAFTKLGGGRACAGVFLSQLFYWTPKATVVIDERDGWVWKTGNQWFGETGLCRDDQVEAREIWKKRGVIEEKLAGQPAKLHFRINRRRLVNLLLGRESYEKPISAAKRRSMANLNRTGRKKKGTEEFVEARQTESVELRQTESVEPRQASSSESRQTSLPESRQTIEESTAESTAAITSETTNSLETARAALGGTGQQPVGPPYPPDENAVPATSPSSRYFVPNPFPVDKEMRAWAAEVCPLVDIDDATEKLVIEYSPAGKAGADAPRFGAGLWLTKWRTWMRREQKFEKQAREKDSALDRDRPQPYVGGAATRNFAEHVAASEKYATCPDCLGTNLKQVAGKGVTGKCKHERWTPPAAPEIATAADREPSAAR